MSNPANSTVQNLLPVQAYFSVDGQFQTFIGQGQPFSATIDPDQSGLHITNSTIDSSPIGSITPSTGSFTSGQVAATPTGSTDIANKLYVDSVASGLSWKQPFQVATTAPITLSGFPIIDTYQTVAGDRVLVKNQANAAQNGIYVASSGSWSYASDGDSWNEYISAIGFVEYGSQKGSAWYCSAQGGGTLGVTDINWSNFSVAGTYFAGTGLTLAAYTFSITNTGVTAATYGSASSVPVVAVNAQGQITSATDTTIAISNTQVSGLGTMSTQNANSVAITGGTINGTPIGGTTAAAVTGTTITAGTQFTGPGTGLTGTATGLSIGGNAATATSATSATTATNLAGGAAGSLPYQSAAGATSFLAIGSNSQVLTINAGVLSWATPTTGTVTSVSGTGTVSGLTLSGTVTSSGSLTLGGSLDLSSPPAIGGTTPAAITGTTITATSQFSGPGTGLSGTATSLSIGGNAATATSATSATTATNLAGGLANKIAYQTGAGATSFIDAPTVTSSYLGWNGSAFAWSTISAGLTVTDDTSTNATRYLTFTSATSGSITGINTSSTKLSFNPSTGLLSLISATMAGTASAYAFKTANIAEPTTVSATAATGTINYDVTTQSVLYYTTNASANWTVNFRGSSGTSLNTLMATNDTIAVTFMVTQGATAYYNSAVTIDGNAITPKWQGGTAPTSGNASSVDVYNYVITKTASATYTVLASITQFK